VADVMTSSVQTFLRSKVFFMSDVRTCNNVYNVYSRRCCNTVVEIRGYLELGFVYTRIHVDNSPNIIREVSKILVVAKTVLVVGGT
jgi:hypothetical protein